MVHVVHVKGMAYDDFEEHVAREMLATRDDCERLLEVGRDFAIMYGQFFMGEFYGLDEWVNEKKENVLVALVGPPEGEQGVENKSFEPQYSADILQPDIPRIENTAARTLDVPDMTDMRIVYHEVGINVKSKEISQWYLGVLVTSATEKGFGAVIGDAADGYLAEAFRPNQLARPLARDECRALTSMIRILDIRAKRRRNAPGGAS